MRHHSIASGDAASTSPRQLRIALLGTRGIPARYGGFETCVEEVGQRLVRAGHQVQVYCRLPEGAKPADQLSNYLGMQLIHLPAVRRRTLETLTHTALSVASRSLTGADCAIVFNAANAPFLPVLRIRNIPVATHVDGLEWRRAKWSGVGQRYYRAMEALAVRWSDALIADAVGISDYYQTEFDADTTQIAYGAPILQAPGADRLAELGLAPRGYHLVVARFEPENHVLEIVQGYTASAATLPLVVVGSAPYADDYKARIEAAADNRVRLLGGLWDQDQLNQLYANTTSYIHGHSVGGTNPSLLRAAGAGAYTIAYDCIFNREVLDGEADFFTDAEGLGPLILSSENSLEATVARGASSQAAIRRYDWDDVAQAYERLCYRLAEGRTPINRHPSGRRIGSWVDRPAIEALNRVH